MIQLTQRQISHGLFGLLFTVSVATLALLLINDPTSPSLGMTLVACVVCGILWGAYWYGWQYAPQTLIALLTIIAAFGMPVEFLQEGINHSIYVVPVMALVLAGPAWVLGSALVLLTTFAYRGGGGAYIEPIPFFIFAMIIGGMVLSRLAVDNVQRLEAAKREADTERERAEAERARVAQQASELAQRNAEQQRLLELVVQLETPTIAVAEGVLLAPIVGAIDSRRTQMLTTRLLHEASVQRARRVILDISGVSAVDTQVAQALVQAARGLELLGCKVTLTGISATVATTLSDLGVKLDSLAIARSPQEALVRHEHARR